MSDEINTVRAVVRALDGDMAVVEVAQGGCGRCHEEGGCGGQNLSRMFCSSAPTYRVDNGAGAEVGDQVTVAIASGSVRRSANLAYGVPLLAMIGGAAVGNWLAGDLGGVVGAVSGMAIALITVRSFSSAGNSADRPYIVSRC